jgi:Family of unknown function (DUF5906)
MSYTEGGSLGDAMDIYFLQARVRLVKQFQFINNELQSLPYPLVSRFTSHHETVRSLKEFYDKLVLHADQGHCLLKGILHKALMDESRAGTISALDTTYWLLIDVDGLIGFTPDDVMTKLDLSDISYIVQYSASSGVKPDKGLSCHIFIMLERGILPSQAKDWLIEKNLSQFSSHISLNKLNESLHWPLDITTCQNDKLIYTAPPICIPKELDKHIGPRIVLVTKTRNFLSFKPTQPTPSTTTTTLINSLREQKHLPKTAKTKLDRQTKFLYTPNPAHARVTGIRQGEEFTHLNLNDGDSWGYYHPNNRPEFIHNFKGEPIYKTPELLPEYWNELQKVKYAQAKPALPSTRTCLAFRDQATDTYYNGWYDSQTDDLTLHEVRAKDRLHDFLTNNGQTIPESIPDWTCDYRPLDHTCIDVPNRKINWFRPSPYMLQSYTPVYQCPQNILYLLHNVFGNEEDFTEYLLNWIACAFRYRLPNQTALIAQGVPGTGKGMFINEVMRPLFGSSNVSIKRMSELSDKFNEYIENTLLCFIDEINIGEDRNHDKIMADLKQQITEPVISVRKMRMAAREAINYANWIFSTNNKQPIKIEEGDRRYNVGAFCEVMLKDRIDTYAFVVEIQKELPAFVNYLMTRTADKALAASVCHNEARQYMIDSSMITADVIAKAINKGDLQKLYDYLDDLDVIVENQRYAKAEAYGRLIKELILTERNVLTREELAIIFDSTVGRVPRESAKFSQYLGHHDLRMAPVWCKVKRKAVRGIKVQWVCDSVWLKATQDELQTKTNVVPLKKAL